MTKWIGCTSRALFPLGFIAFSASVAVKQGLGCSSISTSLVSLNSLTRFDHEDITNLALWWSFQDRSTLLLVLFSWWHYCSNRNKKMVRTKVSLHGKWWTIDTTFDGLLPFSSEFYSTTHTNAPTILTIFHPNSNTDMAVTNMQLALLTMIVTAVNWSNPMV